MQNISINRFLSFFAPMEIKIKILIELHRLDEFCCDVFIKQMWEYSALHDN